MPFYFSKPVIRHLRHFVDGMLSIGFTGELSEIHASSHHYKHRTTLGHFLQNGAWDERYLIQVCQQRIRQKMRKTQPVFVLLDDTICQKVEPSSHVTGLATA